MDHFAVAVTRVVFVPNAWLGLVLGTGFEFLVTVRDIQRHCVLHTDELVLRNFQVLLKFLLLEVPFIKLQLQQLVVSSQVLILLNELQKLTLLTLQAVNFLL